MKKLSFLSCTSFLLINVAYASTLPLPPRATVWGLGGGDVLGRGDVKAALFGNDQQRPQS